MTLNHHADFAAYVEALDSLASLDARRDEVVADSTMRAEAALGKLRAEDRALRDALSSADSRLDLLTRDVGSLARRAGVAEEVTATPVSFVDLAGVEDFLRAARADAHAADSSWAWVERARTRQAIPQEVRPGPTPSDPSRVQGDSGEGEPRKRVSRGRKVAVAAAAAIMVVAVIAFVLGRMM